MGRDYNRILPEGIKGIKFRREPKEQDYGTVAVFEDLYGNLWDLLQLKQNLPMASKTREQEFIVEMLNPTPY